MIMQKRTAVNLIYEGRWIITKSKKLNYYYSGYNLSFFPENNGTLALL